jgi:hypothetical protein
MGQRKVNALDPISNVDAANNTRLIPCADPGTGVSEKMTIAQAKAVFSTYTKKYVATGSEASTLTITELADKEITLAFRGPSLIYETASAPAANEFTFDGTNVGLPFDTTAGEVFFFHYKTPA